MPFNQSNKNKMAKLNRKRKIETSSSSNSSSSSDSDSDSEKEEVKQSKNLDMKRKKKQLSRSSTTSTFNWASDLEDEPVAKTEKSSHANKHKNTSPHSQATKKSKLSFSAFESSKSQDKEDHSAGAKKRSFQDDSNSKQKDEKIKKKKLQKQASISEEDKHSSVEKESSEKKSSISKTISETNDIFDDLSKSSANLKKKKKKKDKLKDKNQKEKSIDHLQSPKSSSSFMKTALNKQQLKEDLELSDSDSDVNLSNLNKSAKEKVSSKSKKEDTSKDKKLHKSKKDEKHEKKPKISEETKSSMLFSDSDSEVEQPTIKQEKSSKKQKKTSKDKDRNASTKSISKPSKVQISSDSSDNESIVVPTKSSKKKDKEKEQKRISKDKKHSESTKEISKQKSSKSSERQSSISDLSAKQHYSDKALTSDSESDSESDNVLLPNTTNIKNKSSPKNTSSERIFNTLANRSKVFTSSDSEHSDNEQSATVKKETAFLSPNKIPTISSTNNLIGDDLWLMENSQTKCETWNDITKTEESFTQYLNKTSLHSSTEWEESDDEIMPKSTNLLSNPFLSSPNLLQLSTTSSVVNNALANQIAKDPEPRPLTSSTGKEVLKAIKSPKKTDLSHLVDQKSKKKEITKQQKEDKCKENNEERKKKNKKSKEHRGDQKHHKEENNAKKLLHTDLLFDSKEIKQEPVIAAAAQIRLDHSTQLFGGLNAMDSKSMKLVDNKLNLPHHQPTSPFSEKQAHQLLSNTSSSKPRLLTDLNQTSNKLGGNLQSAKLNDLFGSPSDKAKMHTSPNKSESELSSSKKLMKANEMTFSISEESSNDEFPAIGVSFSSSSSNSSNSNSGSISNQNVSSMLPNISSNISKEKQPAPLRKYEEEAAIEAKRLEAELMKTKDHSSNWKSFNKDPNKDPFLDLMVNTSERSGLSSNNSNSNSSKPISTNLNLSANKSMPHKKPQNKSIVLENATTIFNVITSGEVKDPFLDSDETQFKISDGKDELDDQRKIEDDLAVSALLELEMKNTDDLSSEQDSLSNKPISNTMPIKQQRKSSTSNDKKTDVVVNDEEPHRLQIAEEDLLNENSVDSDVFHSAIDEMPDTDEANQAVSSIANLSTANSSISTLTNTTVTPINVQESIKSPIHKLRSPLLSPTHMGGNLPTTIIEAKPTRNIVDVSNSTSNNSQQELQFNHSDYGADENELTIDLNDDEENLKKSSFMSTLDKLTSNNSNKHRKNSSSSINLFDLPLINSTKDKEIEIPTSLADVKQQAANNKIKINTTIDQTTESATLVSPKHSFANLSTSSNSGKISSDKESSNQSATDALLQSPTNNSKKILDDDLPDKSNLEQRPRRGRRAKARKSSESEDGLKLVNTPLSPTNISPNNSLNISGSSNKLSDTSTGKLQGHPRRSTRGLLNNDSNDKSQQDDLVQNDSDNQSTNNADDNQSQNNSNTDSKRKRGRKKKNEQANTLAQTTKTDTTSKAESGANKNLSPYDIFEFNDSDEENSPTLPLMSLHGAIEQSHRTTVQGNLLQDLQTSTTKQNESSSTNDLNENKSNKEATSFFEQITPVTPLTQAPFSLSTNTSPTTTQINAPQSEQDKEYTTELYTTELSQKGKLSITIRLQQKDKDQLGNSPEHNLDHSNDSKPQIDDNQNSCNSSDMPSSSSNKPLTRKSARLQSQNNQKTTIDDVIDDVVKGNVILFIYLCLKKVLTIIFF